MKSKIGNTYGSWTLLEYTGKYQGKDTYKSQYKCGIIAVRCIDRLKNRLLSHRNMPYHSLLQAVQ